MQPHDIIANLALAVNHKQVSRFTISQSDVLDGAALRFHCSMYSDINDLCVKFNDEAGCFEEGLDTGCPRHEFLTLLMNHLKNHPVFDGPTERRYLVCNSRGGSSYF